MSVYSDLRSMTKEYHKNGANPYRYKSHLITFDSGSDDDRPFLTHEAMIEDIVKFLDTHADVKYFAVFRLGAIEYQKMI